MSTKQILIGKILSTHGLTGNVKLESFCENPQDIFSYNLYDLNGNKLNCKQVGKTSKLNVFLAKFDNINSIDEAREYRNFEIFIKKEDLPEVADDEIYIDDLIDMNVNGEGKLGKVVDVYNYGASDVVEIKWEDGKTETVPFTEDFIQEIDKNNNVLYINLPKYI